MYASKLGGTIPSEIKYDLYAGNCCKVRDIVLSKLSHRVFTCLSIFLTSTSQNVQ